MLESKDLLKEIGDHLNVLIFVKEELRRGVAKNNEAIKGQLNSKNKGLKEQNKEFEKRLKVLGSFHKHVDEMLSAMLGAIDAVASMY